MSTAMAGSASDATRWKTLTRSEWREPTHARKARSRSMRTRSAWGVASSKVVDRKLWIDMTKQSSRAFLLRSILQARPKRPKRQKTELERLRDKAKREKHERAFEFMWKALGGPALAQQHRFCEGRKWPFDFAHLGTKVAIEIEGGVWINGRHNRGRGFIDDRIKYLRAQLMGWTVFSLTPEMITRENVQEIINFVKEMERIQLT